MSWQDTQRFIGKLSCKKLANMSKLLISYKLATLQGRGSRWGLPMTLSVEPTTSCNLGCPECPSGLQSFSRPTGTIDVDYVKRLVDEVKDHLIYLYFYFQGEPYVHPQFTEMVDLASQAGLYTVTSSNGHFLTPRRAQETLDSGLDRLIISIDGSTQTSYGRYRKGGKLDKVLRGIETLLNAREKGGYKNPHVIWQTVVFASNEDEIDTLRSMAKSYGVDAFSLKTAQLYDYENGHELMPSSPTFSRYQRNKEGKYELKQRGHRHCWKAWHSAVMTWDGKVVPCCFDKDAEFALGNYSKESVQSIWTNDLSSSFMEQVQQSRQSIPMCNNCSEGVKIWR